jgi:hypothetical protein
VGNGTENPEDWPKRPAPPAKPTDAELENRFSYHPPKTPQRVARHAKVTELTLALAKELRDVCSPGRGLSCALTALEEARMWANQSIACDSTTDE